MDNELSPSSENLQLNLLCIGDIILGFPQDSILGVKNIDDLKLPNLFNRRTSFCQFDEYDLPVFIFNSNLEFTSETSIENKYCIAIKHIEEEKNFIIICDNVKQNIDGEQSQIQDIHPLLKNSKSPINGLLEMDSSLILITQVETMYRYIDSLEKEYV